MKKIKTGTIAIILTAVVPSAFAAGTGKAVESKVAKEVKAGTVNAAGASKNKITALVLKVEAAGLLGKMSRQSLEAALANEEISIESYRTDSKGVKSVESIKLSDLMTDLSSRSKALTQEQIDLAAQVIEATSNARSSKKSEHLNKLLIEATAMLQPGAKTTSSEVQSYLKKLTEMNELVVTGQVKNIDQAAEKILTDKEKNELKDCIRG